MWMEATEFVNKYNYIEIHHLNTNLYECWQREHLPLTPLQDRLVFDGTRGPTMQWILFVNIKKYPDE